MLRSIIVGSIVITANCFTSRWITSFSHFRVNQVASETGGEFNSWQKNLDTLLNIDTSCDDRRGIAKNLFGKWQEISKDVIQAVQDRDLSTIAPKDLEYGKSLAGIQTVQKQLITDILPDLLSKGVPKFIEEGPKKIQSVIANPDQVIAKGKEIVSKLREIQGDASLLQSTVEDLRREAKNVLRRTPEGLETPIYDVISKNDIYEVRKYSGFSVCGTKMIKEEDEPQIPVASGNSFNMLAGYIFGDNSFDEKMSMTTPVITVDGMMEFVLPGGLTADTAPLPTTADIFLKDVSSETVAVIEFTGFATDGEVSRQRALLEDALLADGIEYDNLSLKVLQYNPPYTVPFLRRNEISLKVISTEPIKTGASEFSSSPEAGD
jgi:hypothetical protein